MSTKPGGRANQRSQPGRVAESSTANWYPSPYSSPTPLAGPSSECRFSEVDSASIDQHLQCLQGGTAIARTVEGACAGAVMGGAGLVDAIVLEDREGVLGYPIHAGESSRAGDAEVDDLGRSR